MQLPSFALMGLEWLKIPIYIVGGLMLIYGLFRYGPTILRALRDLIAALLGGFWHRQRRGNRRRTRRKKRTRRHRRGRSPRS